MADTESAGIATNAQAAKPINIERFINVSLRRRFPSPPQPRRLRTMRVACKSSPGWRLANRHSPRQAVSSNML